jgi:hypothetical protein
MIELLSKPAFPRLWWHWVLVALAAEVLWFCFMYPLVPRSLPAVAFEALLPLPLMGYIYLAIQGLLWISGRRWSRWTKRLLSAAIALSVVAAGVWVVDWAVLHTSAAFEYRMILRL